MNQGAVKERHRSNNSSVKEKEKETLIFEVYSLLIPYGPSGYVMGHHTARLRLLKLTDLQV